MAKKLLTCLLLCLGLLAHAQNEKIKIGSFQLKETDLTANTTGTKVIDQNGNKCALIKVETTQKGFYFDTGMMDVVEKQEQDKNHPSEIWVYVSPGVKKITIQHPQWGKKEYKFPVPIEAARTYIMRLITPEPVATPNQTVTVVKKQFLVIEVTPKDAMVTVDGDTWPVSDGVAQKQVEPGIHTVRVEALDYHQYSKEIEVNNKKEILPIVLRPSYGFLKIEGDSVLLSQSSIYVDNTNGAEALYEPKKLNSGVHSLKIIHPMYKSIDKLVTVVDGKTETFTAFFKKNFSHVTFLVEADADIYVDGEFKGRRVWSDDLLCNTYSVECRMKDHTPSFEQILITDDMKDDTIRLRRPVPISGSLVVVTTPPMATLYIDNKKVGETPMQYNCPVGKHEIRIEKDGCAPFTKTVTIKEGEPLEINHKLNTGKNVLVMSGHVGDKVMVDGEYMGETPLEIALGFGSHIVKVMRDGVKEEKKVDITLNEAPKELLFELSRVVTIETQHAGDSVFIDGQLAGLSPVRADLLYGSHDIHAQRDGKLADMVIDVKKDDSINKFRLRLHGESNEEFIKNGIYFATVNFAYDLGQQTSFGACFGTVKKIGWFVSAMSNFDFQAMGYDYTCDAHGYVDGSYPNYTGESCNTRLSLLGGVVYHLAGPLCVRAGAGYGGRWKSWKTKEGDLVKMSTDSYAGLDLTAGLQLNLKGFVASLDAVTTNFKNVEVKVGLGYCWKKK